MKKPLTLAALARAVRRWIAVEGVEHESCMLAEKAKVCRMLGIKFEKGDD